MGVARRYAIVQARPRLPRPRLPSVVYRWFTLPLPLCRAEQVGGLAGFRPGLPEGRACFSRGQVPQAPRVHQAAQDQSGIGVPFSLVPFSWACKRKELVAGLPPANRT